MNIKLLKNKDFSLLMLGKLVSLLGSNMIQFAVSLYVLAATGSALAFASMLSISILPRLLLSPIAGVFGDWFDRKKTIVFLDLFTGAFVGIYAFLFFLNGSIDLWLIYVFVIVLEAIEIFFHSAMSAVVPSMVSKERLLEANSLQTIVLNFGQLLAPTIAALIYGFAGMPIILIVTAICFALSAVSEMFIKIPKIIHDKPKTFNLSSFKTDLVEGIKIIKSSKFILTIIGIVAIINFTISPLFSIGITYVIKEVLHASDLQFGLYQTMFAVASIAAPLLLGLGKKNANVGALLFKSFLLLSLTVLAISLVPSNFLLSLFGKQFVPYLILLGLVIIVGLLVTIVNITLSTIFSQIVPLEAMGRASAVLGLASTILIPLGQITFGFLFDNLAPSYVIIICGVILVVTVLIYRIQLLNISKHIQKEKLHEVPVPA